MKRLRLGLIIIAMLLLNACVDKHVHEFNEGLTKFAQQDYQSALEILSVLADNGYAPAQFRLGVMYVVGLGMENNPKQAAYWFEKAAQQQDLASQYSLARLYLAGVGVPKSEALALRWFEQVAERDYAPAQFEAAQLYEKGQGVEKNDAKAEQWFRRAAENQYRQAQLRLAAAYQQGTLGLPQDAELARYWLEQTRHEFF